MKLVYPVSEEVILMIMDLIRFITLSDNLRFVSLDRHIINLFILFVKFLLVFILYYLLVYLLQLSMIDLMSSLTLRIIPSNSSVSVLSVWIPIHLKKRISHLLHWIYSIIMTIDSIPGSSYDKISYISIAIIRNVGPREYTLHFPYYRQY